MTELMTKLFITHGAVQSTLVLCSAIVLGTILGKIRFFGVSFGIGGILFSGIILGQMGFSLDPKVLSFTREFGLILFVYAIGMAVGPSFLESMRNQGLRLCGMAVYVVLCGALVAALCFGLFGLSAPETAGIFSGAVTNTPALGSANEAWIMVGGAQERVAEGLKVIGMAYAVAYPFGIFGILLTMMLLKALFKINVPDELATLRTNNPKRHESPNLANSETLLVSNGRVSGQQLAAIAPGDAEIRMLIRNGNEYAWNGQWKLRLEDKIIVQKGTSAEALARIVGNDPLQLEHPDMLAIFVGIFAGILLGSIPLFVPGLPTGLRLGVAGGALVMGIILSRVQRLAGLTWHMRPASSHLMREIGILLFMACVGLYAGKGFADTVINGPGLRWMGIGALITFMPLFSAALFCRAVWKLNFPTICGMLAGSMTDPPALAFAMHYYGAEIVATGYSTVYPVAMILRILMGQLLVLLLVS